MKSEFGLQRNKADRISTADQIPMEQIHSALELCSTFFYSNNKDIIHKLAAGECSAALQQCIIFIKRIDQIDKVLHFSFVWKNNM